MSHLLFLREQILGTSTIFLETAFLPTFEANGCQIYDSELRTPLHRRRPNTVLVLPNTLGVVLGCIVRGHEYEYFASLNLYCEQRIDKVHGTSSSCPSKVLLRSSRGSRTRGEALESLFMKTSELVVPPARAERSNSRRTHRPAQRDIFVRVIR